MFYSRALQITIILMNSQKSNYVGMEFRFIPFTLKMLLGLNKESDIFALEIQCFIKCVSLFLKSLQIYRNIPFRPKKKEA